MTFPFSDEFKFNLLKATREDDMTSSTIKNLNGDICDEFFCFSIFPSCEKCPEKTLLHAREGAEENDTPKVRAIFEMLEPRKSKDYLQKENKANWEFLKKHFF